MPLDGLIRRPRSNKAAQRGTGWLRWNVLWPRSFYNLQRKAACVIAFLPIEYPAGNRVDYLAPSTSLDGPPMHPAGTSGRAAPAVRLVPLPLSLHRRAAARIKPY